MAQASDYPISFPYGATSPPYGTPARPYHRGQDRAMPVGTPVIVNGVQIGLSGVSGLTTGSHLHIGRFVGGVDTNPGGGGFSFNNAVVTQIASDATNGNFVRLTADGASWVYCHLRNQTCRVGQVLRPAPQQTPQGGDEMIANADQATKIYHMLRPNGGANQDEINGTAGRRTFAAFLNDAQPEINARDQNLRAQTDQLNNQAVIIGQLNSAVQNAQNLASADALKDAEVAKQLDDAHAQIEVLTTQLTATHTTLQGLQAALPTADPAPPAPEKGPSLLVKVIAAFLRKKS